MEEQYRSSGIKVIWLGFQDKQEKIREFVSNHGVRSSVGYDDHNKISRKYGIGYGAGLIMIDRQGTVKKRIPKGFSEKALLEALNSVVSGTNTNTNTK